MKLNNRMMIPEILIFSIISLMMLSACSNLNNLSGEFLNNQEAENQQNPLGNKAAPYPSQGDGIFPYPPQVEWLEEPIVGQPVPIEIIPTSPVFIDIAEIVVFEESVSGYGLRIVGTKPTPCHYLEIDFSEPDHKGQITISVYSTTDPGEVCVQMIEQFDITKAIEPFDIENTTFILNDNILIIEDS